MAFGIRADDNLERIDCKRQKAVSTIDWDSFFHVVIATLSLCVVPK